jgi:UrcA family protein
MNTSISRSISITVLVLAWSAASSPAHADAVSQPNRLDLPSVRVRFADLNPSTPEGVKKLYARVKSAAHDVCGTPFSLWDGTRAGTWKACYLETIDKTVRDINWPNLTALHEQSISASDRGRHLQAGAR